MKRLTCRVQSLLIALFSITVLLLFTAFPAQATEYDLKWVNPSIACKQQYGGSDFASEYWNSPNDLYCWRFTIAPPFIDIVGTLDAHRIDNYCKATYGSSSLAEIGYGWKVASDAWWCAVPR